MTTKTTYEYICPDCGCWWTSTYDWETEDMTCPQCLDDNPRDDSIEYWEDYEP